MAERRTPSDAERDLQEVSGAMRDRREALEKAAREEAWQRLLRSARFVGFVAAVLLVCSPIIVASAALLVREFVMVSGL